MGQKVHPLGFRLGRTQKHLSNWYAVRKNYSKYLFEDHFLRQKLYECYAGLAKIEIHRNIENHFDITLHVTHEHIMTLVGSRIEKIQVKRKVLQIIKEYRKSCFFQTYFSPPPPPNQKILLALDVKPYSDVSATAIAKFYVELLEARVPYRKVKQRFYECLGDKIKALKGYKIQISGRLQGAEIARSECMRKKRLPLHTLNADIDYSCFPAHTIHGVLGIKIWVLN